MNAMLSFLSCHCLEPVRFSKSFFLMTSENKTMIIPLEYKKSFIILSKQMNINIFWQLLTVARKKEKQRWPCAQFWCTLFKMPLFLKSLIFKIEKRFFKCSSFLGFCKFTINHSVTECSKEN